MESAKSYLIIPHSYQRTKTTTKQTAMTHFRKSPRYQRLLDRAVSMEEVLTPHEAMEWIESAYGPATEDIPGTTLHMMVFGLCLKNGYPAEISEIDEAVLDFINA
jgi:hypothetical protein